jgi:hypothetical protein
MNDDDKFLGMVATGVEGIKKELDGLLAALPDGSLTDRVFALLTVAKIGLLLKGTKSKRRVKPATKKAKPVKKR